jgi:hypothetical protein
MDEGAVFPPCKDGLCPASFAAAFVERHRARWLRRLDLLLGACACAANKSGSPWDCRSPGIGCLHSPNSHRTRPSKSIKSPDASSVGGGAGDPWRSSARCLGRRLVGQPLGRGIGDCGLCRDCPYFVHVPDISRPGRLPFPQSGLETIANGPHDAFLDRHACPVAVGGVPSLARVVVGFGCARSCAAAEELGQQGCGGQDRPGEPANEISLF